MNRAAWTRRQEAARKYRPKTIRLLLVAEAPPEDDSRYFYFEGSDTTEPLFEQVSAVLFEGVSAGDKTSRLKELRRRGVFVVELKPDAPSQDGAALRGYVEPFLLNLETLSPAHIVLIGPHVHGALHAALEQAELPLVDAQIPSAEHDVEFRRTFRQALVRADLENLIRPPRPAPAQATD
jgi:hypothetical protein